jgi:microcystin-dependent protein
MATPVLNPKITTAGLAIMPGTNGVAVKLTHIAIGTGKYALDANAGARVALVNEVARFPISSGTNPTPTSVQVGVTITDTDPNGKSPNDLDIGEIGFYAGNTLWAVWSQANTPLFRKSKQFDVPFAYTFDVSEFPRDSVTVQVTTDVPGMTALINQHEAKSDPHTQYVGKLRGMGEYDATFNYMKGAHILYATDGKTYRSLVDNNLGAAPASNPTKWERWGHSVAEMAAEFVPARTGINTGSGVTGILRVTNPDGLAYAVTGSATGAIKIALPPNSASRDSFIKLRLEVFELASRRSMTIQLAGHCNTSLAWDSASAAVLGDQADRGMTVRFGNDGALPCIWIGETNTAWTYPRVFASELMVSQNGDGSDRAFWSSGWTCGIVQALGTVGVAVTPSLVFARTDVARVEGLDAILATKQGGLGYVPVQQGGGIAQGNNKLYMGWGADGSGLRVTVDSTDLGTIALTNSPALTGVPTAPTGPKGSEDARLANTQFVTSAIRDAQIGMIIWEPRVTPRAGWIKCNGVLLSRTQYAALWASLNQGGLIFQESDWQGGYWGGFSYGDGSTNFRIPDLRGVFIRTFDDGRGVFDPGRAWPGQYQASQNIWHAHGGAIAAVGDHVHGAWTDAQGAHAHSGSTTVAGWHDHSQPNQGSAQAGSDNAGVGVAYPTGFGTSRTQNNVAANGNHSHGLSIDAVQAHGHNVGIGAAGYHTHGLTINGDGGNESRPVNVAMNAFIRII